MKDPFRSGPPRHPPVPQPSTAPRHQQLGWGCLEDPRSAAAMSRQVRRPLLPKATDDRWGTFQDWPRRPLRQPRPLHLTLPQSGPRGGGSPQPCTSASLRQGELASAPRPACGHQHGAGFTRGDSRPLRSQGVRCLCSRRPSLPPDVARSGDGPRGAPELPLLTPGLGRREPGRA